MRGTLLKFVLDWRSGLFLMLSFTAPRERRKAGHQRPNGFDRKSDACSWGSNLTWPPLLVSVSNARDAQVSGLPAAEIR